jgi:ankyrin repeat protein
MAKTQQIFEKKFPSNYRPKIAHHFAPIDDDEFEEIAGLVNNDKLTDIQNKIINNKTLTAIRSSAGDTLLHVALESELSANKTYNMCRFLIENNAPISLPNDMNVYPIQLAARQQLTKVVELLLEYGAPVLVLDKNNMNPLHYQISGDKKTCINPRDDNVRPLIKPNPEKLLKAGNIESIQKITDEIYHIFTEDPTINMYIQHIFRSFKNTQNIFPADIFKNANTTLKLFNEKILETSDSDNTKFKHIYALITGNITSMATIIKDKTRDAQGKVLDPLPKIDSSAPIQQPYMDDFKRLFDESVNAMEKEADLEFVSLLTNMKKLMSEIAESVENLSAFDIDFQKHTYHIYNTVITQKMTEDGISGPSSHGFTEFMVKMSNDLSYITLKKTIPSIFIYKLEHIIRPLNELSDRPFFTKNSDVAENPYFIHYIMNCAITRIKQSISDISVLFDTMRLSNLSSYTLFNHINYFDLLINNICIYILLIFDYYVVECANIINDSHRMIHENPIPSKTEQNEKSFKAANKNMKDISKKCQEIYTKLVVFMGYINSIIEIINKKSSINYIRYFNIADISNARTQDIYDIFDRRFEKFPLLPNTIKQYSKIPIPIFDPTNNMPEQEEKLLLFKSQLIEQYLPQIHNINYSTFFINTNVDKYDQDTIMRFFLPHEQNGNLYQEDTYSNLKTKFLNTGVPATLFGYLNLFSPALSDHTSSGYLLGAPYPLLIPKKTQAYDNYIYDEENPIPKSETFVGSVGFRRSESFAKKDRALGAVGFNFGKHLYFIKQGIIAFIKDKTLIENRPLYAHLNILLDAYITDQYSNLLAEDLYQVNRVIKNTLINNIVTNILNDYFNKCTQEAAIRNIMRYIRFHLNTQEDATYGSLILDRIGKFKLLKTPKNYKLDLNDTFNNILDVYDNMTDFTDPHKLQLTSHLLKEKRLLSLTKHKEHIIFNYLFNGDKLPDNSCFIIDPKLTELLLSKGVSPNEKDTTGHSPLFYSINIQNPVLVDKLVNGGAQVNTVNSQNSAGQTPFMLALSLYLLHLEKLANIDEVFSELNDTIVSEIRTSPEFRNNILIYSDNIFNEALLLINHYFYLTMRQYKNGWSYDNHEACIAHIRSRIKIEDKYNILPLQTLYEETKEKTHEDIQYMNLFKAREKFLRTELKRRKLYAKELDDQKASLEAELASLQNKSHISYYKDRSDEIKDIIRHINNKLLDVNVDKFSKDMRLTINLLTKEKLKFRNSRDLQINAAYYNPVKIYNVVELHNSFNRQYINGMRVDNSSFAIYDNKTPNKYGYKLGLDFDTLTYLTLWDKYIKSIKKGNSCLPQIHMLLSKYLFTVIKEISKSNDKAQNKSNLVLLNNVIVIVKKLHTCIFKQFVNDYEDLPLEYNSSSNYALTIVLDIITHIVQHNICTLLYNTIIKTFTKYLIEVTDVSTGLSVDDLDNSRYIMGMVDHVIENRSEKKPTEKDYGSRLMKYIIDIIPKKLVKFKLQIFENDEDPDRSITYELIFANIINILLMNRVVPLTKKEVLIEQLNTEVKEYFNMILDKYIIQVKNLIDNYMRYIKAESSHLDIIAILCKKALSEAQ